MDGKIRMEKEYAEGRKGDGKTWLDKGIQYAEGRWVGYLDEKKEFADGRRDDGKVFRVKSICRKKKGGWEDFDG